jgi:hypothetical protein
VVLQVNYQDAFSPWYIHSFKKGVDRTTMMVLKARKAGAGKIRIYGKSQGSDVTARVVAIMAGPSETRVHHRDWFSWWRGQGNPDWFEGGFLFGNPAGLGVGNITVTSYAAPPADEPVKAVVQYSQEDQTRYYTASYPSEAFPSRTLYVPFVAKGWAFPFHGWCQTTEMVLLNPSSTSASEVEVRFYHNGGNATPEQMALRYVIPARGSMSISGTVLPQEWISPGNWGTIASCVVRASTPICGMVRNRIGAGEPKTGEIHTQYMEGSYRAFATRGQDRVHVPIIAEGSDGYASRLVVQNTGDEEATFTVRFHVQGEGCVAVSPLETLAPGTMRTVDLPESGLFPSPLDPFGAAANAVVQVEDPAGKGTVAIVADYAHPEHGAQLHEGIPEGVYWNQKRPDIVDLPLIRDQRWEAHTEWDTVVHMVNMGTVGDDVLIHYREPDGSWTPGSVRKPLDPGAAVAFWGAWQTPDYDPPDLFAGSGQVEGSGQKLLGATVHLAQWGKESADYHDILLSYSAWW